MNQTDYKSAFRDNEQTANQYAAACLRVLALVVAAVWLLNVIGVFVVPATIMTVAGTGGILIFMLPTVAARFIKPESPALKYISLACCVLGITLLSAAMPKHLILAWMAPIALSCHYYSKRLSYSVISISLVFMLISLMIGIYYGEWDSNLLDAIESQSSGRVVTPELVKNMMIFYFLPRAMILMGVGVMFTTLADRTHKLLERQAKDSAEKQQIESELSIATDIQTSMLPSDFPNERKFNIYATMNPAKEVGGDFYDFYMIDDKHLAVVIADVSGKGVPAALFMVIGKTLLKDHTQSCDDLGEVFSKVNNLLCESNSEGLFITAFAGVLDLDSGEFRYVNAGHNPPLIRRADGSFEYLRPRRGFVLAGMEDIPYLEQSMQLNQGDEFFFYTDGVTEATNARQELYGEERLLSVLNRIGPMNPQEICSMVKSDVDRFVGEAPQFDDITMLSLQYHNRYFKSED